MVLSGQSLDKISYVANDSVFPNPERGFYRFSSVSSRSAYTSLDVNTLLGYRAQGISVLFRYFYLENFTSSDISSAYLSGIEQDFSALRKAGMKAVIRFTYTESTARPYGDAPLDIALRHIEQLKSLLQKNSDVILVLQAGFIGAWGEWFYTDNYANSPGVIFPIHWAMRKELVNALLDALPENRMIQLRTPMYKYKLLDDDTVPIAPEQAYTALPKARLAHHNDCFVASYNDYGTYDNVAVDKHYLERDSKYTMVGGETCNACTPCSDCPNALAELARFHWSVLNMDYHPDVLGSWRTQRCFETVVRKLGYRYYLISSEHQSTCKPGGAFQLNLRLMNSGFSNPVNPRKVQMLLRNTQSGQEYLADIADDPRFWPLNDTIKLDLTLGLPIDIPVGDYKVFFNMPDPEFTLYSNPAYSIRFANNNVWEKESGMNSLQMQVQVEANASLPDYNGSVFFKERTFKVMDHPALRIDGSSSDWKAIPVIAQNTAQPAESLKVINSIDSLYVLVTGSGMQSDFQFFINADKDTSTGYNAWQWSTNGADYMVENGILYKYSGTSHTWGWQQVGTSNIVQSDSVIEFSIPFSELNSVLPGSTVGVAFVNDPQGTIQTCYLPEQNARFLGFDMLLNGVPELKAVGWQGNVILFWQGNSGEGIFSVLQRAVEGSDFENLAILPGSEISYADQGLDSTLSYSYRLYQTNGTAYSASVIPVTVHPKGKISEFLNVVTDGDSSDWTIVKPIATSYSAQTLALRMVNSSDSLFFSLSCPTGLQLKIYLNTDRNSSTGLLNPATGKGGYEYLISGDSLFYVNSLAWVYGSRINRSNQGLFLEYGIALADIGFTNANSLSVAAVVGNHSLPDTQDEVAFTKFSAPKVPEYFKVNNSQTIPYTRIVLEWARSGDASGYVIERSIDDMNHFSELFRLPVASTYYHDNSVDTTHTYYYRMFAYNGIYRSGTTAIQGGKPGSIITGIFRSLASGTLLKVYPNPFAGSCEIHCEEMDVPTMLIITLYDCTGRQLDKVYDGMVDSRTKIFLSGENLSPGVYFIRAEGHKFQPTTVKLLVK